MKKIVKRTLTCLLAMTMLFTMGFSSSAKEKYDTDSNGLPVQRVQKIELKDNTVVTTLEDMPSNFTVGTKTANTKSGDMQPADASTGWKDYKLINTYVDTPNARLGWHPDFSTPNKCNGYYFSSTNSVSFSVGIAYKAVSVSVAASGSSGFFITADPSYWTRPAVYGDIVAYYYEVKQYTGAGILIGTSYETIYRSQRTYIVAEITSW